MDRIFDCHAHIYPAKIAQRASQTIGDFYQIPMRFDGTADTLLTQGAADGISRFLVHSVATTARQVASVNDFIARTVRESDGRLTGFATLHQDFERPDKELERAVALGLRGVKLHPDFQKFQITDPRMDAAYAAMQEMGLPVLIHTGDKRYDFSSPRHIPPLKKKFPRLTVICAHLGGYTEWDEALRALAGEDVYVDTSSSLPFLGKEKALAMIEAFGYSRVLFGSDYPMWSPGEEARRVLELGLPEEVNRAIFYDNMARILGE